jgi:hypothetical protein
MLRRLLVACPLFAGLACPLAALAVEPGNWELSLVTMLTGQPKPAAATETRCLTNADAKDPSRVLPKGTCEFSNRNDTGRLFTFDVSCTGILPMKGTGKVEYTASTMEAELDMTAAEGGFGMRTFLKGRRLGSC